MKAIETRYQGYRFRSRLEARWAVFFDALGLKWAYEPEGFELSVGYYLPDFLVEYPGRWESEKHYVWFEVKGDVRAMSHKDWAKLVMFQQGVGDQHFILLDGTPSLTMYESPIDWLIDRDDDNYADIASIPTPFRPLPRNLNNEQRGGWMLWSHKGRLWWDEWDNIFSDPYEDCFGVPELKQAITAARSARFEHGECG